MVGHQGTTGEAITMSQYIVTDCLQCCLYCCDGTAETMAMQAVLKPAAGSQQQCASQQPHPQGQTYRSPIPANQFVKQTVEEALVAEADP
jgi:hypothetical protein